MAADKRIVYMPFDIPSWAIPALKLLPTAYEKIEEHRLKKFIEEMRAQAAKSPSMVAWRAAPGTSEHDLYERMVKTRLLVRSTMFPNTYELPTRYH
jgi:hypothetical protein